MNSANIQQQIRSIQLSVNRGIGKSFISGLADVIDHRQKIIIRHKFASVKNHSTSTNYSNELTIVSSLLNIHIVCLI